MLADEIPYQVDTQEDDNNGTSRAD